MHRVRGLLGAGLICASLALSGCFVVSDAPLFSAAAVTVAGGRMNWDTAALISRVVGAAGQGLAATALPKDSAYVLVDGDPMIIEGLNGSAEPPPPAEGGRAPLKPGYLALKVLQLDAGGRIVRGVIWPIACPPPGHPLRAGLSRVAGKCIAASPEAVRLQAATPPPLQSAFFTWVAAPGPARTLTPRRP